MKSVIGTLALAALSLSACQQQEPAAAPLAPPPPAEPPLLAAAPPPEPVKPPPASAEERLRLVKECTSAFNARDFTKLSGCYAENATSEAVDSGVPPVTGRATIIDQMARPFTTAFPDVSAQSQLTLVSGSDVLTIALLRGTHQGPLPMPNGQLAATNKKVGYLMLQHWQLTDDGRAVQRERLVSDMAAFLGQLGQGGAPARKPLEAGWSEPVELISSNSDAEKANIATVTAALDATNKRDAAGLMALAADDIVLSDLSAPADKVGKKEVQRSYEDLFKAFPDLKLDATAKWAGGDYVVTSGRLSGTNTGDSPAMKLRKTGKSVNVEYYAAYKLAQGKIKNTWLFSNGLAFATQLGMAPAPKPNAASTAPATKPAGSAASPPSAAAGTNPGKPAGAPAAAAAPGKPNPPSPPAAPQAPVAPKAPASPAVPAPK